MSGARRVRHPDVATPDCDSVPHGEPGRAAARHRRRGRGARRGALVARCSACADLYFDVGATITPVQVDADRRGYVVATAETADAALMLADAAAQKLVVRTLPRRRALRRFVSWSPSAGAALAPSLLRCRMLAFRWGPSAAHLRHGSCPRRAAPGALRVQRACARLLDRRTAGRHCSSPLRKSGALLWRRRGNVAACRSRSKAPTAPAGAPS